jgi:hypothetical protein
MSNSSNDSERIINLFNVVTSKIVLPVKNRHVLNLCTVGSRLKLVTRYDIRAHTLCNLSNSTQHHLESRRGLDKDR